MIEFIAVTDRLPPSDQVVLVKTRDQRVVGGQTMATYRNETWHTRAYGYINGVTHWAMLPQPGPFNPDIPSW